MGASLLSHCVVVWPNLATAYIMSIIASYLTDVWGLSITRAAAIVNVYSAVKGILPVGLISIVYVTGVKGSYWMILLSRLTYTAGLVLLTLSTPPILSRAIGICSSSKADCIGQGQKALFYTALPLIVGGVSSYYASALTFLDVLSLERRAQRSLPLTVSDQPQLPTRSNQPLPSTEQPLPLTESDQPLPSTESNQPLPPTEPDQPLPHSPSEADPQFLLKESHQSPPPTKSDQPLQPSESADQPLPPSESADQQGSKREKFFAVVILILIPGVLLMAIGFTKPWSIKFGIGAIFSIVSTIVFLSGLSSYPREPQPQRIALTRMFRLRNDTSLLTLLAPCLSCILTGVVISIGNSYFIEQATNLNNHHGKLVVPVIIFPNIIQKLPKKHCLWEIKWLAYAPQRGIAASLVFATLSCITAAKIESRRLGEVEKAGFIDDPTSIISMSIFALIPQFLLLGMAEEVSQQSVINVLRVNLALKTSEEDPDAEEMKESKRMYLELFAQAVSGVGMAFGVLSVYAAGEVSAKVGGTSWFQDTLNRSRLDNYYWTLSALTAANLVWFFLLKCSLFLLI